jgi:hypothetical protein
MATSTVNDDGSATFDDGNGGTLTLAFVPDPNEGDQIFISVTRSSGETEPEVIRFKQYGGNRLAGKLVDVAGSADWIFVDPKTGYVTTPA